MDLTPTPRARELAARLAEFMESHVHPAEKTYRDQLRELGDPHAVPPVIEELKAEARRRGLWNLFLGDPRHGPGLSTLEYAPLAEMSGRSPFIAPEALNCAPPDAGNMEILAEFGTPHQQERWLAPLLAGEIRSCFAMTEPAVASSDATNIRAEIRRDGDGYVVRGRKWWTSGAVDPRARVAIVMGVTDPEAEPHRRQSMVLVPFDAPGVTVVRSLPVFGYDEGPGHAEVVFDDVRVPAANLLGEEGGGFAIAQARLGPGRLHHCMRAIGMAERALELMCERARTREAFGGPLADKGVVQDDIAEARIRIDGARLLVLRAAWLIDTEGKRAARVEVSAAKVAAPRVATWVIDRAIQVHGGAGVSDDVPLAAMYAHARTLRILDGPDEVHKMVIARRELTGRARAGA
jgi:acyl-CoA dehydrogenase